MDDRVKIVECPRDAWQGLPVQIPSEVKAEYLRKLIDAGFTHIDAVSFVSASAVPQMADSERVLEILDPPEQIEVLGIVVNRKGAERAILTGAVRTLGFPFSISPEFLRRNQRQKPGESLIALESVSELARDSGLDIVAYISMAFGNPYGEPWSVDAVIESCERVSHLGVRCISLADTVGIALPKQIGETLASVIARLPEVEFGIHLHSRRSEAPARIRAAFEAGCRRFDGALGGIGGCPFAQDALVGNIPTEILIKELGECRAVLPRLDGLRELIHRSGEIAAFAGTPA